MLYGKPKYLVISTCSDRSLHRFWCPSEAYDTFLIYYGDGDGFPGESTYYLKARGPKFHLIEQALQLHPEILSKYHYVWLPDDDVLLSSEEVARLFDLSFQYNLHLSQPALIGWYGPSCVLTTPGTVLRYTNWVEIMCPCLSRQAIHQCRPTFTENITGWSIDAAWNVLLGHPRNRIAVIDDVVAIHTRPVFGGDVYKQIDGDNPLIKGWNDSIEVKVKYNLNDEAIKDMTVGKPLGQGEIFGCVTYGGIPKTMEEGRPRNERRWPPNKTLWDLLDIKLQM